MNDKVKLHLRVLVFQSLLAMFVAIVSAFSRKRIYFLPLHSSLPVSLEVPGAMLLPRSGMSMLGGLEYSAWSPAAVKVE